MKKCEECGKTLGIFQGYRHPTLGKRLHLCSNCFDYVNESVTKWGEFILSNSFKNVPSKNNFPFTRNNLPFYFSHKRKKKYNVLIGNKI
jgi:hypothetical protein